MPLVADDWCSSADTLSLAPAEWNRLNMYLGLLEMLIMPHLYWCQKPVYLGGFVKTLSTV